MIRACIGLSCGMTALFALGYLTPPLPLDVSGTLEFVPWLADFILGVLIVGLIAISAHRALLLAMDNEPRVSVPPEEKTP